MADTNFVFGTVITSAWLNDANQFIYHGISPALTGPLQATHGLSVAGNFVGGGAGQRFQGNFNDGTIANRFAFQDSTLGHNTTVFAIPNGGGNVAGFFANNDSTLANGNEVQISIGASDAAVNSTARGSSSALPLNLKIGNITAIGIGTPGTVTIPAPSSGVALTVNAAAASPAFAVVGVSGQRSFQVGTVANPNIVTINNTDAGAANLFIGNASVTSANVFSGQVIPLNLGINGNTNLSIDTLGNVSIPTSQNAVLSNTVSNTNAGASAQAEFRATASAYYVRMVAYAGVTGTPASIETNSGLILKTLGAGAITLQNNSTALVSVLANGNVTIAPPQSGVALTVQGGAIGSDIINATGSFNGLQSFTLQNSNAGAAAETDLYVKSDTGAFRVQVQSNALGGGLTRLFSGNAGLNIGTNSTDRIAISSAGNVTINTPSSGVALSVGGTAVIGPITTNIGYGLQVSDGFSQTDTTQRGGLAVTTNDANPFGLQVGLTGNAAAASRIVNLLSTTYGGAAGVLQLNSGAMSVAGAGNVTVAAPTSGVALSVAAFSTVHSTKIADSANNSFNAGYLEVPQNAQSAPYTAVLSDSGKSIDHPSTDANARTYTIPANASVAYPVGTCLSFSNMTTQVVTIAITSDVLNWSPTGGTGSRTLAQYGVATARKVDATHWLITGTGLT